MEKDIFSCQVLCMVVEGEWNSAGFFVPGFFLRVTFLVRFLDSSREHDVYLW